MDIFELQYDGRGLIPAIVQQHDSGEVLMMAWMNEESLRLTLETGQTWFWSRSRGELWNKGATSGNTQEVIEVRYDCDADCLLVAVDAAGPACHTGQRSCFYRSLDVSSTRGAGVSGTGVREVRDRFDSPREHQRPIRRKGVRISESGE